MPLHMGSKARQFDPVAVTKAIATLRKRITSEIPESITARKRNILRKDASDLIEAMREFVTELDPVKQPPYVLDPADPHVVGEVIATTLLAQPRTPIDNIGRFYGSGVYAIYYVGDFPAYTAAAGTETPLYVGKAAPAKPNAETPEAQGLRLSARLGDHQKSLRSADNLLLEDFECRFLVVKSAWQNTAETYLIEHFQPIWNNEIGICFGFGKHGDNSRTRKNKRSPWDTLHPGRSWTMTEDTVPNQLSAKQITKKVLAHYKAHPPKRNAKRGLKR